MRHSRESEMTDPVARNRLAALLNDAAMAAWLDHLNPQAPWPMDSMLFVADYLLTAGVLPPDVLDAARFCRYGHPTPLPDFCAQGHPLLEVASGIPLSRCTGETADCPHYDCPDGWHEGTDLPCDCTPDCAV